MGCAPGDAARGVGEHGSRMQEQGWPARALGEGAELELESLVLRAGLREVAEAHVLNRPSACRCRGPRFTRSPTPRPGARPRAAGREFFGKSQLEISTPASRPSPRVTVHLPILFYPIGPRSERGYAGWQDARQQVIKHCPMDFR